jgi:hypothetical protein
MAGLAQDSAAVQIREMRLLAAAAALATLCGRLLSARQ